MSTGMAMTTATAAAKANDSAKNAAMATTTVVATGTTKDIAYNNILYIIQKI